MGGGEEEGVSELIVLVSGQASTPSCPLFSRTRMNFVPLGFSPFSCALHGQPQSAQPK